MKNRKQLYYIIFIVISIIAFSCSTKEINDYYYRYLKSEKLFKVSFIANVAAYTQQDALPEDRIITMYTYDNDGNYYATNNYRTDKPGIPTPINSSGLEVPTGVYNFYALSIENNSGYPPSLDNSNYISDLKNGYDYLYYSLKDQNVQSNITFDITFNRCCAKVILMFEPQKEYGEPVVTLNSIDEVSFYPPSPTGLTWDVLTGDITPAESLSKDQMQMTITGFEASQIVLPLDYSDDIKVMFKAGVNGLTSDIPYNVDLPMNAIGNKFLPGHSYQFLIEIGTVQSVDAKITIQVWNIINENGVINPLLN